MKNYLLAFMILFPILAANAGVDHHYKVVGKIRNLNATTLEVQTTGGARVIIEKSAFPTWMNFKPGDSIDVSLRTYHVLKVVERDK